MEQTRTYDLGDDLAYWVALHRVHRLGSVRFGVLERAFERLEQAWWADHGELVGAGLDSRTATAVVETRGRTDPAAELEQLREAGIEPLARGRPALPLEAARDR
jgi:predicted Rossmann fold nucleotide-binding protein DprA/Smf involved in DNA uptake